MPDSGSHRGSSIRISTHRPRSPQRVVAYVKALWRRPRLLLRSPINWRNVRATWLQTDANWLRRFEARREARRGTFPQCPLNSECIRDPGHTGFCLDWDGEILESDISPVNTRSPFGI